MESDSIGRISAPGWPPKEFKRERRTIEEWVHHLIYGPDDMSHLLEVFLDYPDPDDAFKTFFNELTQKLEDCSEDTSMRVYQHIRLFPSDKSLKLLTEHGGIIVRLMECLPRALCRDFVGHLLVQHKEGWQAVFQDIVHELNQYPSNPLNPARNTRAGIFIRNFVGCLHRSRSKSWIKFCVRHLPCKECAPFILAFGGLRDSEGQENKWALCAFKTYLHAHPLDLTEHGLWSFIEALVLQKNDRDNVQSVLKALLDKFYLSKTFDVLVSQFNRLSCYAQINLLAAMSPSKREILLNQYGHDVALMAGWIDDLFLYYPDFESRKDMIRSMCDHLEEERVTDLVSILHAQGSQVGGYLLICLSEQDFDSFVFNVPCEVRSALLFHAINDSTRTELMRAIEALDRSVIALIYTVMTLDLGTSTIPVDSHHPLTLRNGVEILKQVAANKELIEDYASFIARIPPLLIGLLAFSQEKQKILKDLAPVLTEEQLKFLFVVVSWRTIEELRLVLSSNQFVAILEAFTNQQIREYVQFKADHLQACHKEFTSEYRELQKDLNAIEEGEIISSDHYQLLNGRVGRLHRLSKLPTAMDYHHLLHFLHRPVMAGVIDPLMLIHFKRTMEHLSSKRALFEGNTGIVANQLRQIEALMEPDSIEDEDLSSTLYTGFWTMVREGTLPYLGITPHGPLGIIHAGELTLFGIRSNQDLHYLGISGEADRQLDECKRQVAACFQLSDVDPQIEVGTKEFTALWDRFTAISTEAAQQQAICGQLLCLLPISSKGISRFRVSARELCRALLKSEPLDRREREMLVQSHDQFELGSDEAWTAEDLSSLWGKLLPLFRAQYPLIRLQRYLLGNANLKQSWQTLFSLGYHSITDLFNHRLVQEPSDLLRLEEIAKMKS